MVESLEFLVHDFSPSNPTRLYPVLICLSQYLTRLYIIVISHHCCVLQMPTVGKTTFGLPSVGYESEALG